MAHILNMEEEGLLSLSVCSHLQVDSSTGNWTYFYGILAYTENKQRYPALWIEELLDSGCIFHWKTAIAVLTKPQPVSNYNETSLYYIYNIRYIYTICMNKKCYIFKVWDQLNVTMLTDARKVVFQINDCKMTSLEKMVTFFYVQEDRRFHDSQSSAFTLLRYNFTTLSLLLTEGLSALIGWVSVLWLQQNVSRLVTMSS